jgi:hypothetical protein
LKVRYSYFHSVEPMRWEPDGDYANPDAVVNHHHYEWTRSLGDIINPLISNGMKIEFLHEFPVLFFKWFPFMERDDEGWWRIQGDKIPLTFSLKATKT